MQTATTLHRVISHLLVLLQVGGVALSVWPVGMGNRGSVPALVPCALGAASGLDALVHNRIGKGASILNRPPTPSWLRADHLKQRVKGSPVGPSCRRCQIPVGEEGG